MESARLTFISQRRRDDVNCFILEVMTSDTDISEDIVVPNAKSSRLIFCFY